MAQKYPEHIQKNLDNNKNYYSLYNMDNIKRCKVDPLYLGEAMLANECLIWHSIHKYVGNPEIIAGNNGIERDDILQLGRMGFIKAIHAFDTERGIKFSSFSVTAIVREVRCYIRDSASIVRLTRTAHSLMNDIKRVESDLGYMPTVEELSYLLDEKEEKVSKVMQIGKPVKYLDEYMHFDNATQSVSFLDLVDNTEDVEAYVTDIVYIDSVIDSIRSKISDIDVDVIKSQISGVSQTQTAKDLNISQMRVSRIIKKVANLIRNNTDLMEEVV
jgi:RNA polymerase sigma factor (sigma-70 family)